VTLISSPLFPRFAGKCSLRQILLKKTKKINDFLQINMKNPIKSNSAFELSHAFPARDQGFNRLARIQQSKVSL
jgi:hypothetical protein